MKPEMLKGLVVGSIFWVVVVIGLIILAHSANAITLKSGECISVGNATYSIQYCAPPVCSANLTLGQNSTYLNQTDSCAINITTIPQEVCNINQIMGLNSTYLSNSSVCNVTIKTPEYSCPAFPVQPKCAINTTLIAKENETVNFTQSDNLCDLFVGIEPVPICPTFRLLQNQSIVSNEVMLEMTSTVSKCGIVANTSAIVGAEKERYKLESEQKQTVIDSMCNINDTELLYGWKKIDNNDRRYLHIFVAQKMAIDNLKFSQILYPELVRSDIRENYDSEAKRLLDVYFNAKFSKDVCELVTLYGANYSLCGYYPLINLPCIDKAAYLESIETTNYGTGKTQAQLEAIATVIILIVALAIYLNMRSGGPLR